MYYYCKTSEKFYFKYGKIITEITSYDIYDIYEDSIISQLVVKELPDNVRRVSKGVVKEHYTQKEIERNYLAELKLNAPNLEQLKLKIEKLKKVLEKELNWKLEPVKKFKNKKSQEVYNFTHFFFTKHFLKL